MLLRYFWPFLDPQINFKLHKHWISVLILPTPLLHHGLNILCIGSKCHRNKATHISIVGSVVECSPATRAARVRFPDDASSFLHILWLEKCLHKKWRWPTLSSFNFYNSQKTKISLHRPGIEPGPPAWQASILPLNQRCWCVLIYLYEIYDQYTICLDYGDILGLVKGISVIPKNEDDRDFSDSHYIIT